MYSWMGKYVEIYVYIYKYTFFFLQVLFIPLTLFPCFVTFYCLLIISFFPRSCFSLYCDYFPPFIHPILLPPPFLLSIHTYQLLHFPPALSFPPSPLPFPFPPFPPLSNLPILPYLPQDWTIIRPGGLKSDKGTGQAILTEDTMAAGREACGGWGGWRGRRGGGGFFL